MKPDDFFSAIENGDVTLVKEALSAEPAWANARNPEGLSPITVAAYWGAREVLDLLLEGGRPLDFWEAAIVGQAKRVGDLLDADPSLAFERSPDGFTALHLAAFFGSAETAQLLIAAGADVGARTTNALDNQPLHAAVAGPNRKGRLACARLLLEAGASPNEQQAGGSTPLMSAAQNGDTEVVDILLSFGASPGLVDDQGRRAADHAAQSGNTVLAEQLLP
jgi:uncharacterized protein